MRSGDRVSSVRVNAAIAERIEKRQEEINMATIIKKSSLPILGKGKAGVASVTIQGGGQIQFSPLASKAFGGRKLGLVSWDEGSRTMEVLAFEKPPKGYVEGDCFVIGYSKKSKGAYFAGSALLQDTTANIGYNYKESGNQTFVAEANEEKHKVLFQLPEGALAKKPVQKRAKKKTANTPAANTAPAPVASAASVNSGSRAVLVEE